MRALKMFLGLLLALFSALSLFPMLAFNMPHPFLICGLGIVAGTFIFWYYKSQKQQ